MGRASINDWFRSPPEEGCVSSPLLREEALPWPTANAPGRTGARLSPSIVDVLVEGSPPCVHGTPDTFLRRSMKSSGTSSSFVSSWLVELNGNPVLAAIDDSSALTNG